MVCCLFKKECIDFIAIGTVEESAQPPLSNMLSLPKHEVHTREYFADVQRVWTEGSEVNAPLTSEQIFIV